MQKKHLTNKGTNARKKTRAGLAIARLCFGRYVYEESVMKYLIILTLTILGAGMSYAENPHDFSNVDSREKAINLVEEGKLVPLLLFPAEFGGQDIPQNTVYVPPETKDIQTQIIGTLIKFVEDGLIDNLKAEPEYKGNSFVPSKIHMYTGHSGKEGQFNPTIEIW